MKGAAKLKLGQESLVMSFIVSCSSMENVNVYPRQDFFLLMPTSVHLVLKGHPLVTRNYINNVNDETFCSNTIFAMKAKMNSSNHSSRDVMGSDVRCARCKIKLQCYNV